MHLFTVSEAKPIFVLDNGMRRDRDRQMFPSGDRQTTDSDRHI